MTHSLESTGSVLDPAAPVRDSAATAPTLYRALARLAAAAPRRPALLATRFAPLDRGALCDQLDGIRHQLRRAGLGREAKIGVMIPDAAQAAVGILGVACSAVAVPLDPRLGPAELDQFLEQLPLDALLIIDGGPDAGYRAAHRHDLPLIIAEPAEDGSAGLLLRATAAAVPAPDAEPEADAPAFILRSSGTTARPKLIPFSHRNMLAAAHNWQRWFRLNAEDRCLCVSAPYYSHGLKVTILTPLLGGGSVAFPLSPATVDLHEWFETLQPSWYSAGPALHRAVLEATHSRPEAFARHRLRFASSGGAPLQQEIVDGLQAALGMPLLEHYGSSEAAQIAVNTPFPGEHKAGTVGRPLPGSVRIVDDAGASVAVGERGEVLLRGPTLMAGYLGDPALNQAAFHDGWFHTGDLGSFDADGFLRLHGRLREVINRGGEKVSLQEVDDALLRHPAVAEAAAFAVPHPRLGEDVAAAVVLRPGMQVEAEALREYLRGELVYFKVPRRIQLLDELPRGLTGKVLRHRLSDALLAMRAAQARAGATTADALLTPLERDVLGVWRRLLKTDAVGPDDNFFDCGGDSLLATEMLAELEQLLGRMIPETVLVEESARKLAARLQDLAGQVIPVIEFNQDPQRTPLFWFHGDFAQGGYYIRRLAKLLGARQPLIAIAPHGLDNEPIPASVEQMARARLPLILERQTRGPYRIGGYCNGALVAFETARLLIEAGEEVEIVALIDPPTANVRPWSRVILRSADALLSEALLARTYEALSRFGETSKWPYPKRIANLLHKLGGRLLRRASTEAAPTARDLEVRERFQRYSLAMARYLPGRLAAPVVYFSADYTSHAWRNMGIRFESYDVLGGHHRCVKDYTASIATPLRALLEQAEPGPLVSLTESPDHDRTVH